MKGIGVVQRNMLFAVQVSLLLRLRCYKSQWGEGERGREKSMQL